MHYLWKVKGLFGKISDVQNMFQVACSKGRDTWSYKIKLVRGYLWE